MPKIDFCFQGWVRGVNITNVSNVNGENVNVETMPPHELIEKLAKKELFVSCN